MLPTRIYRSCRPSLASPFQLINADLGGALGRWFDDETEVTGTYPVDIREDDDHVYVEAELPGFTKDQVNATFEKGVLSIVAERKPEKPKEGQTHVAERRFTRVARSFTLPNTVDENKIEAQLADGVLHLKLSKREEVKPRRIDVH